MAAMTCGHPLAAGVERGAPGRRLDAAGRRVRQRRRDHLARAVAPARDARVGGEHDRAHDAVGERLAVAVGVVGDARERAVAVGLVADEGDPLVGAGAERGAGEARAGAWPARTPAPTASPHDSPSPAWCTSSSTTSERSPVRAACRAGLPRDLRVRRDVALDVGAHRTDGVRQRRVEPQPGPGGRLGPLRAQVVGRADDDDPVDGPVGEQRRRQRQREGRLARAGRRGDEEVLRGRPRGRPRAPALPGAQRQRGAALRGGAAGAGAVNEELSGTDGGRRRTAQRRPGEPRSSARPARPCDAAGSADEVPHPAGGAGRHRGRGRGRSRRDPQARRSSRPVAAGRTQHAGRCAR